VLILLKSNINTDSIFFGIRESPLSKEGKSEILCLNFLLKWLFKNAMEYAFHETDDRREVVCVWK
jgi:hypothetical protein